MSKSIRSSKAHSYINPVYSQRNMKTYCITESELVNISSYDRHAKIYYSVASVFFTIFVSFMTNWNQFSHFEKTMLIATFIVSIVFVFLGRHSDNDKGSSIDIIKKESALQSDPKVNESIPLS